MHCPIFCLFYNPEPYLSTGLLDFIDTIQECMYGKGNNVCTTYMSKYIYYEQSYGPLLFSIQPWLFV